MYMVCFSGTGLRREIQQQEVNWGGQTDREGNVCRGRLNRVQGAIQSSFPRQQRFGEYIQVAEEDDDEIQDP